MEKKNTKLALMGMLTICLSQLLMGLGRLDGILPDSVINIIGIAVTITIVVAIIFTVRALAEHAKESKENKGEE